MASIWPPALGVKGCVERLRPTGETTHYDLCVAGAPSNHVRCALLRSGGRRLAVRIMMECHFCALPRTPFPASRDFPSRGNERYEGKNSESYTSGTISAFSPFGGWRHHLARWEACHLILSRLRLLANQVPLPPGGKHVTGFAGRLQLPYESSSFAIPTSRGHYKAPLCCELLMKGLLFRALFCPRLRGQSGEAG